jgi:nucleoside-diphosphate-sugar epimerase
MPEDLSPNRYLEKVSVATGELLDEPIRPQQLLVHNHRDYHVVDVLAHRFMSRVVAATGDDETARRRMRAVRHLGWRTANMIGMLIGHEPAWVARTLFGLKDREYYFRYRKLTVTGDEAQRRVVALQQQAAQKLLAVTGVDGRPRLRVLLTGGTGFVGKEILWQAAHDLDIAEMIVLIRSKEARDKETGTVKKALSPEQRGEALLRQLGLEPRERCQIRFVAGDVEEPNLGLSPKDMAYIRREVTHVIHCAASVAFDDAYDKCFHVNVGGTVNALAFSQQLQDDPAGPFVAHLGIETAYIHGRQVRTPGREVEIVFPHDFYNNYYELTKAMASRETAHHLLEKGLRVVELCPAIILGDSRTGNNRGDTKVINAPVNLFGLAKRTLTRHKRGLLERSSVAMFARMAFVFPCDATAQLNLVPVDWVAKGIITALKQPRAVGRRIHLATDSPVSANEVQEILEEELQVHVRLADPTLHRNVTLPVVCGVLRLMKQEKMGRVLQKLGTVFAGYNEWGQPVHEVGSDVSILGLPAERPVTAHVFRMLCRHNEWVQEFGKIRDADEIARREKVWAAFITRVQQKTGRAAAEVPPSEFRRLVARILDVQAFELKSLEG